MSSPAQDVGQFLDAQMADLTLGQNLFVGFLPPSPVNVVSVFDSGGSPPDAAGYRTVLVSMTVRHSLYNDGWDLCNRAALALHQVIPGLLGEAFYTGSWQQGDLAAIGLDEKGRQLFSGSFRLQRQS